MDTIQNAIDGRKIKSASPRIAPVFNPATGEQVAALPLSTAEEVHAAVAAAKTAAPAWGATPPLKRMKFMFRFKALLDHNADEIARSISREHGKTHDDARGELARGIDVVDFACGIPHLFKGEYSRNVGPEIDSWSDRQPLGVVAGITPFNFPAMVPMWMYPVAIACGNTFVLKPSERDPSPSMLIWELFQEAGFPSGVFNVVHGDREAVDAILDHPDIKAVSFVGSTPVAEYVYRRGSATGKRVQALGGAKNHMIVMPDADMDQAADALMGAGFGSGRRALHGDHGRRSRRREDGGPARRFARAEDPCAEGRSRDGPRIRDGACDHGRGEEAHLRSDRAGRQGRRRTRRRRRAGSSCKATSAASSSAPPCSTASPPTCRSTPTRSSARWCASCASRTTRKPRLPNEHEYGNGVAIFTRDGDTARDFVSRSRSAWSASTCRSRFRWPTTPSAAGSGPDSATSTSTARTSIQFYTKTQDRHRALAVGHQGWRGIRHFPTLK